jgi:hypothetical protein
VPLPLTNRFAFCISEPVLKAWGKTQKILESIAEGEGNSYVKPSELAGDLRRQTPIREQEQESGAGVIGHT